MQESGYHSGLISKDKDRKNLPISPFLPGANLRVDHWLPRESLVAFLGRTRSRHHLMNSKYRKCTLQMTRYGAVAIEIQWDGSNLLTMIGACVCFYYIHLSQMLLLKTDNTLHRPYVGHLILFCLLNSLWIWACIYEPCSSFSREGRRVSAFKAMASFHSISSFGHCSLERFEEGSVDLLERRYIFHKIGLPLFQVARASSFLKVESWTIYEQQNQNTWQRIAMTVELRDEAVLEFVQLLTSFSNDRIWNETL